MLEGSQFLSNLIKGASLSLPRFLPTSLSKDNTCQDASFGSCAAMVVQEWGCEDMNR